MRSEATIIIVASLLVSVVQSSRVVAQCAFIALVTNPFFATNNRYVAEKGYQYRLVGNHGTALDTYRDASRIDESNVEASYGMIYCQLMQGLVEDATQQLEFLSVIQNDDSVQSADLTFLKALIAMRKDRDTTQHLRLLDQAVELHERSYRDGSVTDVLDDYYKFNPDFLVEVAKEYLQHLNTVGGGGGGSSGGASNSGELPKPAVAGLALLEKVTDRVPALLGAHLVMAKARFEMKQYVCRRGSLARSKATSHENENFEHP